MTVYIIYTGLKFEQSILDVLLWFRLHKIAIAGDIQKAFLMISVTKPDEDGL